MLNSRVSKPGSVSAGNRQKLHAVFAISSFQHQDQQPKPIPKQQINQSLLQSSYLNHNYLKQPAPMNLPQQLVSSSQFEILTPKLLFEENQLNVAQTFEQFCASNPSVSVSGRQFIKCTNFDKVDIVFDRLDVSENKLKFEDILKLKVKQLDFSENSIDDLQLRLFLEQYMRKPEFNQIQFNQQIKEPETDNNLTVDELQQRPESPLIISKFQDLPDLSPFPLLTSCVSLDLSNNYLTEFHQFLLIISQFKNLEVLSLQLNQFKSTPLKTPAIIVHSVLDLNLSGVILKPEMLQNVSQSFVNLQKLTVQDCQLNQQHLPYMLSFFTLKILDISDNPAIFDKKTVQGFVRNSFLRMPTLELIITLSTAQKCPKAFDSDADSYFFHFNRNGELMNDQSSLAKLPIANEYFQTYRIVEVNRLQKHNKELAFTTRAQRICGRQLVSQLSMTSTQPLQQTRTVINRSGQQYIRDITLPRPQSTLEFYNQNMAPIEETFREKSAHLGTRKVQSELDHSQLHTRSVISSLQAKLKPDVERQRILLEGQDALSQWLEAQKAKYADNDFVQSVNMELFQCETQSKSRVDLIRSLQVQSEPQPAKEQGNDLVGAFFMTQPDQHPDLKLSLIQQKSVDQDQLEEYNNLSLFDQQFLSAEMQKKIDQLTGPTSLQELQVHSIDAIGLEPLLPNQQNSSILQIYKALRFILEHPFVDSVPTADGEVIRSLLEEQRLI